MLRTNTDSSFSLSRVIKWRVIWGGLILTHQIWYASDRDNSFFNTLYTFINILVCIVIQLNCCLFIILFCLLALFTLNWLSDRQFIWTRFVAIINWFKVLAYFQQIRTAIIWVKNHWHFILLLDFLIQKRLLQDLGRAPSTILYSTAIKWVILNLVCVIQLIRGSYFNHNCRFTPFK